MVPTRRQALGCGAALLAALAGCSHDTETASRTPAAEPPREERPENVAMDPPTVTLRRAGSHEPIVEIDTGDEELDRTERVLRRAAQRGFVTSNRAASMLRIGDVEGARSAREFLTETDFDEAFVFVDRQDVGQCYDLLLCYVTWSAAELSRTYAEVHRDYDVACSADERDRTARLIRLDGSVDPEQIETGGTLTHREGCPVPRWRHDDRSPDGDGTVATGTETATSARFFGGDR